MENFDSRCLPAGLRVFVDVLGVEKAIAVLTEQQGQIFYIPKEFTKDCVISKKLGEGVAEALCSKYPCEQYQVPMVEKVLIKIRNDDIVQSIRNGVSIQELVRRYKITRQQITSINRENQHTETQLTFNL